MSLIEKENHVNEEDEEQCKEDSGQDHLPSAHAETLLSLFCCLDVVVADFLEFLTFSEKSLNFFASLQGHLLGFKHVIVLDCHRIKQLSCF